MERHQAYAIGAASVLAVAMTHEVARIVVDRPWVGITPLASHTISAALAILFTATMFALPLRRESRRLDVVRWDLGVLSMLALVAHTGFTLWLHDPFAVVPFVCTIAAGFCMKRTFDRGELGLGRPTHVAGPSERRLPA